MTAGPEGECLRRATHDRARDRSRMAETPCGSVHESPVRGQRTRQTLKVGRYRLHAPGSAIVLGEPPAAPFHACISRVSYTIKFRHLSRHRSPLHRRKTSMEKTVHTTCARWKMDVKVARFLTAKREFDCGIPLRTVSRMKVFPNHSQIKDLHSRHQ